MENLSKKKNSIYSFLSEYKKYFAEAYLFAMFVILPLYTKNGFYYIANCKIKLFKDISLIFLPVFLILSILLLIIGIKEKKLDTKNLFKFSVLDYAVIGYGVINLISFFLCQSKDTALFGYEGWQMGLIQQLLIIFSYFLARFWYSGEKRAYLYAGLTLITESALVILNRTGNDPFGFYKLMDWFEWNRRNLLGTIGNINWLCGYLILIVPVLIYFYIFQKIFWKRLLIGIGLYLSLGAIMLQGSRSGLATIAVILLFLPIFISGKISLITSYIEILFMICIFWAQMSVFHVDLIEPMHIHTPQTVYSVYWLIPTVLLGAVILMIRILEKKDKEIIVPKALQIILKIIPFVIIASLFIIFILCTASDNIWNIFHNIGLLRFNEEWGSYRGALWTKTLSHFFKEDFKTILFGVGPDNFGPWYLGNGIVINMTGNFEGSMFCNAHNELITALVDTGIIGLVSYIGIFIAALISFIRSYKEKNILLIGIFCVLAYMSNQFFSFQHICVTPLLFVLLAMSEKIKNNN